PVRGCFRQGGDVAMRLKTRNGAGGDLKGQRKSAKAFAQDLEERFKSVAAGAGERYRPHDSVTERLRAGGDLRACIGRVGGAACGPGRLPWGRGVQGQPGYVERSGW